MQSNVTTTLIICGMPVVLYKIGAPFQDGGFLIYLGLAAGMVAAGVIGSLLSKRQRVERGFEPVGVRDAA